MTTLSSFYGVIPSQTRAPAVRACISIAKSNEDTLSCRRIGVRILIRPRDRHRFAAALREIFIQRSSRDDEAICVLLLPLMFSASYVVARGGRPQALHRTPQR
ncbi:hypothetical protein HYPDE_27928 [Hyphomicrobium denitrificans 1NES1]|uniref:Uncharacterized protein n=1 Tax=Hyphomicrobium denitrificans 1NES1 TaxID=670307 RepID=N0BAW3_9HYPH|nr:hypothetical protein HYPDE_27928 [Hyphomicrobium denitrificans 1NES1]